MNVVLVMVDTLRKDHVGAYGNAWIRTPNIDALARESLRFTSAYPESVPSIPARRGIHTGLRSFPFTGWERTHEEDVGLRGWQPIPEGQVRLAEILRDQGFGTMFVTDTLHQFRASYNFQLGFDVFDFIRGQERDQYRPLWMCPEEKIQSTLLAGDPMGLERKMRQYFANTAERRREEDWFAPQVFTRAARFLEGVRGGDPFFLVVDAYDPHEPWDPPEGSQGSCGS
jgi:arylsulfatase A-like enzyme